MRWLFFFFLFVFFHASGNCQSWKWAKGAGTAFARIATDAFGHVYTSGGFINPTIAFGSFVLTNAGTDSTGDIFLAKYDTSGNVIWAQRAGGTDYDATNHITTDAAGNIFISGVVASHTAIFDTIALTHPGTTDWNMFLAKYDSFGHTIWAKEFGGGDIGGDIEPESISVDALGNIYVAGTFSSEWVTFGAFTLIDSGGAAMFIVKYSPSGEVLWAKAVQGAAAYYVSGAMDTMGHIYITGTFSGSVSFGAASVVGHGSNDIFLAKYDSSGNLIWAKDVGSPDAEYGNYITTDISSNVYITGFFDGPSLPFASDTLVNSYSHSSDYYIAKFDSSGNAVWARNSIGPGYTYYSSISVDNSGNVYSAGAFTGANITFGSDVLYNVNPGSYAIYSTGYNSSGNNLWAISATGNAVIDNGGITQNASGQVYVTGGINSPEFYIADSTFTGSYRGQYFIARLDTAFNPYALVPGVAHSNIGLSISPNPNAGSFALHISSPANEDAILIITNVLGEKIKEVTAVTNTATELHIDAPPGMYFISATTSRGSQSTKVVVR